MKKNRLQMLPKPTDYAAIEERDPLRFYYYPYIGKLYKKRIEICLDLLPAGNKILEIGFGSGISFLNLANMYSEIHGIDLTAKCAEVCECFKPHGLTPHLINGSATELPYPDEFFDAVLCISIFEHLKPEEQEQAHKEIHRILQPNGVLVYGVPVEKRLMVYAFKLLGYNIRDHHFSTEKEVYTAVKKFFTPTGGHFIKGLKGLAGSLYEARRFQKTVE